ncbi:MAG TPA: host attachment protein [Candidatus Dormibacteraeota bacterium]|nr:host attachment protein [Candidatus Dormibacteraeota bacterium]
MTAETLVLIGDASRARLFAARRGAAWQQLSSFDYPRGAAHERDILTDRPGRVQQSMGDGNRSAADPKTPAHEVEGQVFARQLAAALDEAVTSRRPQRVVLVAPPRFLGHLRQAISKPVSALVGASLDQNLTALPDHELPDRLADVL